MIVDVHEQNPPSREGGTPPFAKEESGHPLSISPLEKGERKNVTDFSAWQLAWELGYTIAIPIVVLALLGRWADRMLGTTPWLLLVGVLASVIISSALVYRKVSRVIK